MPTVTATNARLIAMDKEIGSSPAAIYTTLNAVLSKREESVDRAIPFTIPADQAYYWSTEWQADVREAMAARAAGASLVFDSDDPDDIVRWLLSADA